MSWQAPKVSVAQTVLWYDGNDTKARPYPALVTGVGKEGIIDVYVYPVMYNNGFPKNGCRHADDPNKRAIETSTDGVWTHNEWTLAVEAKLQSIPTPKSTSARS